MHPSYYYIKYLIVGLPNNNDKEITAVLNSFGMAKPTPEIIDRARAEVGDIPSSLELWNQKHVKTRKWLKAQKIHSMVFDTDGLFSTIEEKVFKRPRDREAIEKMIISGMKDGEISFRLRSISIHIPDDAIYMYRHYFWNNDIMGMSHWLQYFQKDDTLRVKQLRESYSIAMKAGPEAAILRMGLKQQLDSKKILVEVQRELYNTFLETKSLPLSDKKVTMLTDLARGLSKVDERVQAGDSALLETLKKFEKFKIISPQDTVKALNAIAKKGTTTYKPNKRNK